MSLPIQIDWLCDNLLSGAELANSALLACLDLTLLDEQAEEEALHLLGQKAQRYKPAAICVYSKHLPLLSQHEVPLACVVNFPYGNDHINPCLETIRQAREAGAKEIDYVFPYSNYLSGQKHEALAHCQEVISLCRALGLTSKIILETGVFDDLQVLYDLAKSVCKAGCDFLKTSTGKKAIGASFSAALVLLSAIKDSQSNSGIKISGGIKTAAQARKYAALAQLILQKPIDATWFRIGASSLLEEILSDPT